MANLEWPAWDGPCHDEMAPLGFGMAPWGGPREALRWPAWDCPYHGGMAPLGWLIRMAQEQSWDGPLGITRFGMARSGWPAWEAQEQHWDGPLWDGPLEMV